MKNKRIIRAIAIFMALLMVFSVIYGVVSSLTQSASAAVTQGQIDELKRQAGELDKKKQTVQSELNSLKYDQMSNLAKKEVLDERISLTEEEIVNIGDQINIYDRLINEKASEVVRAQGREDAQLAAYRERIRAMEEYGAISYIAVVFDASSFSDLLARIDFVDAIMRADEDTYRKLQTARMETTSAKEELEESKLDQEEERERMKLKEVELEEQLRQAEAVIAALEDSIETSAAHYQEISAEREKLQKSINEKVEELRRQEEARARSGGSNVVGTGQLIWPSAASSTVTSRFGSRYHPIYRYYRMHDGVDIGASYGTSIYAADSGTVVTSAYSSSYGNYVVLSHGNGMTTLYAHMSSRKVKEGDAVSRGSVVGLVGSTGASTGPHLHFEVSVSGSRKNPLDYFRSGTYSLASDA
ncbi:MAG: peptidoglycan DD-metalloendopeptidase family protein [Oscillospiraceae bacterium]|jgi:murein DD-endopeptidase MepM/ murein hydrolase activator NlpD|nr:peptidoglycan DD-metalloendopeptidase family protein [Oscillospiraceae bacterium]